MPSTTVLGGSSSESLGERLKKTGGALSAIDACRRRVMRG